MNGNIPVPDMFFYGTLRHLPLLEMVLGRAVLTLNVKAVQLPDHAVYWVKDEPFPMIQPLNGATADGLLVQGLTEEDVARLQFYEGGFDFGLTAIIVQSPIADPVHAQMFFCDPDAWQAGAEWSLADWQGKWGAVSVRAAAEVMAYYGRYNPQEIGSRFDVIRMRAWAWVQAQTRAKDPDHDLAQDVKVLAHHRPYVNFFAVEELDLQFRGQDGGMNPPVNRGALVVGQAAVVLPYDPVRDCVLLIEQFRAAVYIAGDPAPWVWEPVAGLVDPGETPQQAARREAMEEAGLTLSALEPAGQMYSSTGSSTEFLHLFIGVADLSAPSQGGGLASEGEDIRSEIISFTDLMAGVDANRYCDMPLVTTALWLARHRDRLRRGD